MIRDYHTIKRQTKWQLLEKMQWMNRCNPGSLKRASTDFIWEPFNAAFFCIDFKQTVPESQPVKEPGQTHFISVQRSDGVFLLETDGLFEGL
jgi:hypothetical protein